MNKIMRNSNEDGNRILSLQIISSVHQKIMETYVCTYVRACVCMCIYIYGILNEFYHFPIKLKRSCLQL